MQFHRDGFQAGNPHVLPAAPDLDGRLRDHVDVLIVGCGPAGLTLAAQLAAFPDINTRIIERKQGPLMLGQADGVACRTVEMFEAFGFSELVLKEACWVNETTFWKPSATDPSHIARSGRIQDTEDDLSEFPHVILNQARIHDFYLESMARSSRHLEPDYGYEFVGLAVGDGNYPVTVRIRQLDDNDVALSGPLETIHARYVVGCDGARSAVRQSIGRELHGDSANQAWGVMDVLAVTDFPDIRFKAVIRSATEGNLIIIPREGGYLVRFYVEMDQLSENERASNRNITSEHLIAAARRVLNPYTLDVKELVWWSVYEISQRLCDKFDDVADRMEARKTPRIFIAGDACHTHSPKAGQGMNVSMGDAFNLGWKLAAVLRGQARAELLHTYSAERQSVAADLIEFDRHWAKRFSERPKTDAEDGQGLDPEAFQEYFTQHGRYTAGTTVHYAPSTICASATYQQLATGWPVGMRFHSAPVVRLADAKRVQLGHTAKADGRWRLIVMANDENPTLASSSVWKLCDWLISNAASPIRRHTPSASDLDAVIDVRAVCQQDHRSLNLETVHPLLHPATGRLGLRDTEKLFCVGLKERHDIYDLRGVSREHGCIVLLRPDQYVANILPLDAYSGLSDFFAGFMQDQT